MRRRRLALVLCLILTAVSAALPAAGKEASPLEELADAVLKLALETENVTLRAEVRFELDGTWFKTARLNVEQDGIRSVQRVMMDTPLPGGGVETGGYTVHGDGEKAYAMESRGGPYYTEFLVTPDRSVVRSGGLNLAAARFARQFAALLGPGLGDALVVSGTEGLRSYTLSLEGETVPPALNAAFNLAASAWAREHYAGFGHYLTVEYEDWTALFARYYRLETGREMPEGFQDSAADETGERWDIYEAVIGRMQKDYQQAAASRGYGLLLILGDGTSQWFESRDDYLRAQGAVQVRYEDSAAAFRHFYEQKTGTALPGFVEDVLAYTANTELLDAYTKMQEEMEAQYRAMAQENPRAVAVYVRKDAGAALLESTDSLDGITVTRRLMGSLAEITVSSAKMNFTLNNKGDLLSAQGEAEFLVTDDLGAEHGLRVSFDLEASQHGLTAVAGFDPRDYGVSSQEEYWDSLGQTAYDFPRFPDQVVFAGQEYPSMVDAH